jgi:hypothetical protein
MHSILRHIASGRCPLPPPPQSTRRKVSPPLCQHRPQRCACLLHSPTCVIVCQSARVFVEVLAYPYPGQSTRHQLLLTRYVLMLLVRPVEQTSEGGGVSSHMLSATNSRLDGLVVVVVVVMVIVMEVVVASSHSLGVTNSHSHTAGVRAEHSMPLTATTPGQIQHLKLDQTQCLTPNSEEQYQYAFHACWHQPLLCSTTQTQG